MNVSIFKGVWSHNLRDEICKVQLAICLVELPVLITRLDSKEDLLTIQTYHIDAEVPFLYSKRTFEGWNSKIDG